MELPATVVRTLVVGGFKWALLFVVVDLVSFVLAVAARHLLSDATMEYRPLVIRCFLSTGRTRKRTNSRDGDANAPDGEL
jgi:hypothetical protein